MLVGLGVIIVAVVPVLQVKWQSLKWEMHPKERFTITNEARITVAQILGGSAILAGLYFTNQSISQSGAQLSLAQDGQFNDRFVTGVTQLGDEKRIIRLGGLRTLGELEDFHKYHWIVIDVVAGFVREKAPWTKELSDQENREHFTSWNSELKAPSDIQAAVEVIGSKDRTFEGQNYQADLTYSDLRGADFADFWLENMELSGTHFEFTDLSGAHLEGSDLDECHFEHATLSGANLTGATLEDAILNDSDLSQVIGLSQKQVDSAIGNKGTVLPSGISKPAKWKAGAER